MHNKHYKRWPITPKIVVKNSTHCTRKNKCTRLLHSTKEVPDDWKFSTRDRDLLFVILAATWFLKTVTLNLFQTRMWWNRSFLTLKGKNTDQTPTPAMICLHAGPARWIRKSLISRRQTSEVPCIMGQRILLSCRVAKASYAENVGKRDGHAPQPKERTRLASTNGLKSTD